MKTSVQLLFDSFFAEMKADEPSANYDHARVAFFAGATAALVEIAEAHDIEVRIREMTASIELLFGKAGSA